MNTFVWPTLVAVISGLLVAGITSLWQRHSPPPDAGSRARIDIRNHGDGNSTVEIDQSVSINQQITNVRHETRRSPDGAPDQDQWDLIILGLVLMVAASLAFLTVWDLLLGLIVGASIGSVVPAVQLLRVTGDGAGPRWRAFSAVVVSAGASIGMALLVLNAPFGGTSPSVLLDRIALQYPSVNTGWWERGQVLFGHPGDIVKIVSMGGISSLAFQCLAVMSSFFLLGLNCARLRDWAAFRRVAYGRSTDIKSVDRAARFLDGGNRHLSSVALVVSIALLFGSGLPAQLQATISDPDTTSNARAVR